MKQLSSFSILVAILVFGVGTVAQAASQNSIYYKALSELANGQVDSAYTDLESIPKDSDQFIPALLELQKIHYKKQDWGRFFAYALYYRQNYLRFEEQWKDRFEGKMLILEALALTKHCLWNEANSVLSYGIHIAKQVGSKDLPELEKMLLFFSPLKFYRDIQENGKGSDIPNTVFKSTQLWPIQSQSLQYISHPRILKFELKSRCLQ